MLTEEQKQRMERNRLAALARRAELMRQRGELPNNQPVSNQSNAVSSSTNNLNTNRIPSSTNSNFNGNRVQVASSSTTNQQNSLSKSNNQLTTNSSSNLRPTNNQSTVNSSSNLRPTNNQSAVNSSSNFRPTNQSTVNSSSSLTSNLNNQTVNRTNSQLNGFNNNKGDYFVKPNQNSNFNQNRPSSSNMTQIMNHNKHQNQNNFITPAKRPSEQNAFDKRFKSGDQPQVKSPYEQVMDKSIPIFNIEFKLLDNKEFYLDFRYNAKLIEEVRKIKSARYEADRKKWAFKLENYKEVLEAVKKIRIDRLKIKVGEGFPDDLLKLLEESQSYNKVKVLLEEKLRPEFVNQLFPYQKEGVRFGIKREGRVLLADDMGLGKTLQALAIAMYYSTDWPLLIVTPASVKFQWREAILKWVPDIRPNDIYEIDSRKRNDSSDCTNQIIITSYDSAAKVEQIRKDIKCVILDECHMIKDNKTVRYKTIQKLVSKSPRLILLSGTPAMSKPIELFTQLKLLMPKSFSNKDKYANRYCDPQLTKFGKVSNGCSRPDELKVVLESTVMIRRLKNDVLNQLPPKRRVRINLDFHLVGKDKSELERFMSRFNRNQQNTNDENFLQAYTKTAEIKLESICNYLEIVLEKGTKFIIFAYHRCLIDGISDFLQKRKKSFIKIDGSTSTNERSNSVKHFQENEDCVAAVLSVMAAGVGLTMTAAELVLFGELYFNPGALIQAEDRVHRIGQKNSVLIEYLIAPGTIDDHIWSMIHRKLETLDQLGLKSNDNFAISKTNSQSN